MAKVPISVQYIKDVFEEEDIEKVWSYLGTKFHFNKAGWKAAFEKELRRAPRFLSTQDVFMVFGKKEIEPLLNVVLKRKRYPTWINLLNYILSDKIEERRRRDDGFKNRFYGGGGGDMWGRGDVWESE